jgi:hypothetical protein
MQLKPKSKILKNRNGNTSVRTSGNIDISYAPPTENNQRSKNSKMDDGASL